MDKIPCQIFIPSLRIINQQQLNMGKEKSHTSHNKYEVKKCTKSIKFMDSRSFQLPKNVCKSPFKKIDITTFTSISINSNAIIVNLI